MRLNRVNKGFTLVEVMVVVAVIALLAAIAIPNLYRARIQANESAAQAHLKAIVTSLENYAAINSVYPTQPSVLMGANPPYLAVDYFTGLHAGYSFSHVLADYYYTLTAAPNSAGAGTKTFTITTGGVLTSN